MYMYMYDPCLTDFAYLLCGNNTCKSVCTLGFLVQYMYLHAVGSCLATEVFYRQSAGYGKGLGHHKVGQ